MAQVVLSSVPRSHDPSPAKQLQPRQQTKHGRKYSVQLDIDDKPLQHADSDSAEESKSLPSLPAAAQRLHSSPSSPPETPLVKEKILVRQDRALEHPVSHLGTSPEEIFARRFGYNTTAHPPPPVARCDESEARLSRSRSRSARRRLTPFTDDDEGNLVVLPSPPLLRPASFWRNTRRSALHTPSLHLVRRATFLAAGLALDKPVCDLSAFAVESRITIGKTRGLGGGAGVPVGLVPSIIAHATLSPRQDVSPVGVFLSTTTSSFNWWPYPAGGVTTSTSFPIPTLVPLTSTSILSPLAAAITPSSSTPKPTTSSHSSAPSPIHTTHTSASTSSSVPSPSSGPQSLVRPGSTPHNPLWLVPVCLLSGAVIGCAVGWLAWRHFGEKRDKITVGHIPDGYAWAYKHETEGEHDLHDKDVEHAYGQEYLSSGNGPAYHMEQGSRRLPSTANTSGARTWVGHPQARKRSGAAGAVRISTSSDREHENTNDVRSPLLTQASPSEVLHDSKPLPTSPLPSPYSYGDDEGDDVPYESIRHKSVRRRIWERLGFAEGDLGRKHSKLHEGEGRHTWSASATQERGADVGRTLSFWGRRKTMKEGRVERWVRGVTGPEEGDIQPEPPHQQEVPMESIEPGETSPQLGTPELVLSTLRRVSPSAWNSPGSDGDLATALRFDEKSPKPYRSTLHHLNPTFVPYSATTRSDQHRSLRHLEQRSRGVSLQDPGPVPGSDSLSRRIIAKTSTASKNAFPLRSNPASRSKDSQRSISSPAPPSPESASRYSATPHVPALSSLSRSPTRTPTRSKASRDLRATLTRAAPSPRLARPVSNAAPPTHGSGTHTQTRLLPTRGVHTIPQSQQRPTSELPAGPSSLLSPPLQSSLCFDETLLPSTGLSRAPTASTVAATKLPISSRARRHSAKRVSTSDSTGSTPPNARIAAILPRSSYRSTGPGHTPVSLPAPRPFSPKERYLARQNANARVGMILSRSYSSRNFDERPVSPTMFGAVINEELECGRLEDGHSETHETLTFLTEGGEGIEQRLDRLRKH